MDTSNNNNTAPPAAAPNVSNAPETVPVPVTAASSTHSTASSSRTRQPSVSDDSPGSPDSGGSSESLAADQIELVFMPHPTEMSGDPLMRRLKDSVRYIKTPDHATGTGYFRFLHNGRKYIFFPVDHLNKYLAMRLTLDNMDSNTSDNLGLFNFCIYIAPTPGQLTVLSGNQTMRQVNDKYWKLDKPLEMYYSMKKT